MSITSSPLRYPGGKSSLYNMMIEYLLNNHLIGIKYAEPYAGGAGLALKLLLKGYVSEIYINDLDSGINAFWHSILNQTDLFIKLINDTPITIEEWHKQQAVLANPKDYNTLQLGFATFFLNRTNRSGIIKRAGPIGGRQQSGNYKLDCRFNKESLINKIEAIASAKDKIHLTNLDAIHFMKIVDEKPNILLFIDPPYYDKGSELYTSFYNSDDHKNVAECISSLKSKWILTYDNVPEIEALYHWANTQSYELAYSLQKKRKGKELIITAI